jgi:sialate O-acetylesterase
VIVESDKVAQAVAARYGWERNPDRNLYNKEGLPASPFRSDDYINYFTRDCNPGEG